MTAPPSLAPLVPLWQRLWAEVLGTLLLVGTVVGSGIMAQQLAGGQTALMLLASTLATVFVLYVLIETLAPVSGAHFNPVVTAVFGRKQGLRLHERLAYMSAQAAGAVVGAMLANAMFGLALLEPAQQVRSGSGIWLAEAVAAAGLVFVIGRAATGRVGALVASYIGAAMWFTASTAIANPAATLGRMFSDSFAGIAPASASALIAAQVVGGLLGWALLHSLRAPPRT